MKKPTLLSRFLCGEKMPQASLFSINLSLGGKKILSPIFLKNSQEHQVQLPLVINILSNL